MQTRRHTSLTKFQLVHTAMEQHKWRYALLNRRPNLEASLDDCLTALKEVEHRARACYEEESSFANDEFLQMILVDGCLIHL